MALEPWVQSLMGWDFFYACKYIYYYSMKGETLKTINFFGKLSS
jgi:hypothetical protein